jgi:nitrogen regulatory protein P-II 1
MKLLLGIVRTSCLQKIITELERDEIHEMTISEVRGIGQEVTLFNAYAIHSLILIIVPDEKVEEVQNIIMQFARSGFAGDGILAVCPVDYIVKIRTKERLDRE